MHFLYALVIKSSFSKAQGFVKPALAILTLMHFLFIELSLFPDGVDYCAMSNEMAELYLDGDDPLADEAWDWSWHSPLIGQFNIALRNKLYFWLSFKNLITCQRTAEEIICHLPVWTRCTSINLCFMEFQVKYSFVGFSSC